MADFSALTRKGLEIADSLTESLQVIVTYRPWIGFDGYGSQLYGDAQQIEAIAEKSNALLKDSEGNEIRAENTITIPRPITANGATGREEPIDPRDSFVLPDGSGGIVASVDTVVDPSSGYGYYKVVYLGSKL